MAKFSTKKSIAKALRNRPDARKNLEGGLSFEWSPKSRLYMRAATSLINEPTFYKNFVEGKIKGGFDDELIKEIHEVAKTDPEFILKLAYYARNDLYLRSVPILLIGEASQIPECKPYLRKWIPNIIKRADEPCELLAYIINRFNRKAATNNNPLKKGIAESLDQFDEYQFAKYNRKGSIKLKDVLRITHPKHKEIYSKIVNDSLSPPETWEVVISNFKEKGYEDKKTAWEYLIESNKLPYMASLRNLRNLLKENIDETKLKKALEYISNPDAVKKSKQLPFRFLSAYKELDTYDIKHSSKILDALEDAMELSLSNIPTLDGTTFMSSDVSGSMKSPLSRMSSVSYRELGIIFMCMADKFCDESYISIFGSKFSPVTTTKRSGILENARRISDLDSGCSTNGYKVIEYLNNKKLSVDRIMIYTDMEMYNDKYDGNQFVDVWKKYKSSVNSKAKLYIFNLAAYAEPMVPEDDQDVCIISGWSENIFKYIQLLEKDKTDIIKLIENETPRKAIPGKAKNN